MTADDMPPAPAETEETDPTPPEPVPAPEPAPAPEPMPEPTPAPDPDPDPILQLARSLALAEALKALEGPVADIHSEDGQEVRKKLRDAYDTAVTDGGPLAVKWAAAVKSFKRAVLDMDHGDALDAWLEEELGAGGDVRKLLEERKALAAKTELRAGEREAERAQAQAATRLWATRYADWSAPVDRIAAQIGQYADRIDKLNADINNEVNAALAIFSFWFEIAPRHLQLASGIDPEVQAVVEKVAGKIEGYEGLEDLLTIGAERFETDGSLHLVESGADAQARRKTVLDKWREAAIAQSEAEAAFKLDPDDIASARQRYDKLKDDGWIAEARKSLTAS